MDDDKEDPVDPMKVYSGAEVEFQSFLTSALGRGGQLHASAAQPPEWNPGTHWIGRCVVTIAGLVFGDEKISCPCRGLNPAPSSPWRVTIPTALS